ncbi:hypothetical protein [Miltoncostaea marina]|uniref:hypothetical protein n=1 Tax=Miltoncostaea marina TaxID=2843215 RepID=UPI001C3DE815|nr:hypothetical protein [Miltoncostaea marina]
MANLDISTESATPVATQWADAIAAAASSGDTIVLRRRSDDTQAFFDLGLSTWRNFGAKQIDVMGEGWYEGIAIVGSAWHHLANVPVRLRAKFSFSNTSSAGSRFYGFAHDGLGPGITAAGAGLWNVDGIEWFDCRLSNRDPADDGWGSSGTGVIHFQYGTTREVFDWVIERCRLRHIGGFDTYGKNHDHTAYGKTGRRGRVRGNLAYETCGWVIHGYTDTDDTWLDDNTIDRCFGAFVASAGTSDSFDGTYRESARNLARRNIIANPDGGPEHGLTAPSVMAMLDHDATLAADGPNVYSDNALWKGTGTGILVRTGGSAGRWQDGGGNRTDLEPKWVDPANGDYRQTADSPTNAYGAPLLRYVEEPDPEPPPPTPLLGLHLTGASVVDMELASTPPPAPGVIQGFDVGGASDVRMRARTAATPATRAARPALRPLAGEVPHLAFPLRLNSDRALATVEQDTLADVRQCVHVIARTPRGARPLAPEVGIDDPTFTGGVAPDVIAAELEGDEPRARVSVEATGPGADGRQTVAVRVALASEED